MKKMISVVVPVFNEEGNLEALAAEVSRVFEDLDYELELIFVDDGSADQSVRIAKAVAARDPRVRSLELSRNFGKEAALTAGIAHARGAGVILMDADLQHPPERIPALIEAWEKGAEVAVGVRKKNPGGGIGRSLASKLFSYAMRHMSDSHARPGATDFRLIDRAVADEFNRFTERGRMTRGLIDWLGFTQAYVPFEAHKRHAGKAQYSTRKLFALAFSAFISHSLLPLRIAGYLGVLIVLVASALGLFVIVEQVLMGDPLGLVVSGTAMLAIMILFLNGILLVALGLIALYIGKIHYETMNRPLYVVRRER